MATRLHWIEVPATGRLAISARPSSEWLAEELAEMRGDGIDVVVSLLEPHEVEDLGLRNEARLCAEVGMGFLSFPISDRGVPASRTETCELGRSIVGGILAGQSVVIHCRAGIGRSSVLASCVLAGFGIGIEEGFDLISSTRGVPVPDTDEQRIWAGSLVVQPTVEARRLSSGAASGSQTT